MWLVITIPGNTKDDPDRYAAFNPDQRRSGRLYSERVKAGREVKRRNKTIVKRERKQQKETARRQADKQAAKSAKELLMQFVRPIKEGQFHVVLILADWLEERNDNRATELRRLYHSCKSCADAIMEGPLVYSAKQEPLSEIHYVLLRDSLKVLGLLSQQPVTLKDTASRRALRKTARAIAGREIRSLRKQATK